MAQTVRAAELRPPFRTGFYSCLAGSVGFCVILKDRRVLNGTDRADGTRLRVGLGLCPFGTSYVLLRTEFDSVFCPQPATAIVTRTI